MVKIRQEKSTFYFKQFWSLLFFILVFDAVYSSIILPLTQLVFKKFLSESFCGTLRHFVPLDVCSKREGVLVIGVRDSLTWCIGADGVGGSGFTAILLSIVALRFFLKTPFGSLLKFGVTATSWIFAVSVFRFWLVLFLKDHAIEKTVIDFTAGSLYFVGITALIQRHWKLLKLGRPFYLVHAPG